MRSCHQTVTGRSSRFVLLLPAVLLGISFVCFVYFVVQLNRYGSARREDRGGSGRPMSASRIESLRLAARLIWCLRVEDKALRSKVLL